MLNPTDYSTEFGACLSTLLLTVIEQDESDFEEAIYNDESMAKDLGPTAMQGLLRWYKLWKKGESPEIPQELLKSTGHRWALAVVLYLMIEEEGDKEC